MTDTTKSIILFDGFCNLCESIVKFTYKRDTKGQFLYSPLQSKKGQELLRKYGLSIENFSSFVYIKDEKHYLKSSAALRMLKDLGGIWKLTIVLMILPKPIRDFFYDLIAKSRNKIFGKKESCMVPSGELKERFLE